MRVGPYELLDTLGQGGGGTVHRARGPAGEIVAVKILRSNAGADATARFERERRLLEMLGPQEGFVQLLDAGRAPVGPYIVMPYIPGGTLRDRLRKGTLGAEATVLLATRLARAMARAHERGIVHRDLKPENILFTAPGATPATWGDPLIADLGLAKHWRHDAPGGSQSVALSREGAFVGTAGYMAPEQIDAGIPVTPAVDVFALGAVAYECLAGVSPFEAPTLVELLARLESGHHSRIESQARDVPSWLAWVIEKALETDPALRFPDAGALARALESGRGPSSRSRFPLAVVGGALAVVFAIGALSWRPAPPPVRLPPPPTLPSTPEWFRALAGAERPVLPLPEGLSIGKERGEYVNAKDGSVLVFVPRGSFVMGTEDGERDERPAHEVELSPYFLGKYPVTNEQFDRFVRATGYRTNGEQKGIALTYGTDGTWRKLIGGTWRDPFGEGKENGPDHPVVQVGWDDARAYVKWAALRLPTEAQWERAALWDPKVRRARRYPWGDDYPGPATPPFANLRDEAFARVYVNFTRFDGYDDGFVKTAPVGAFPRGASPCGALMNGNVQEWVDDGYDARAYETLGRKDPCQTPEGSDKRVVRGTSWNDQEKYLPGTRRGSQPPWDLYDGLGFRVAR